MVCVCNESNFKYRQKENDVGRISGFTIAEDTDENKFGLLY